MTLKTSLFNKAVYNSTLKRFAWGSVLYFAIVFINVIIGASAMGYDLYYTHHSSDSYPLLLSGTFLYVPMLLSVVAPTIVALLIFRFLHSKKQVVFVHSSPVSRRANYISSILAGLTLMIVPVFANALILLFYFEPIHCLMWIGINLFCIFIMFSVAVFSAIITGNSFACVVINVLIHAIISIFASSFEFIAQIFVYGFSTSSDMWNYITSNNFAIVAMGMASDYFRENISVWKYTEFFLSSVLIYIISYFIYKKRKSETASDVAGFSALNHIFKYLITTVVALLSFGLFGYILPDHPVVFVIILVMITIISYFGSEMILKKSLNVLYSYKGFIGFGIIFTSIICIFSSTSFFGYETRIPQKEEISQACVYEYYRTENEPYSSDESTIDETIEIHKELTKNPPKISKDDYQTRIHIKYKLQSGKIISRTYPVSHEKETYIMNRMYENNEYKIVSQPEFIEDERIIDINLNGAKIEDNEGFITAVRNDLLNMNYDEIINSKSESYHYAEIIYYTKADNGKDEIRVYYFDVSDKYLNTLNWIWENQNDISR